MNGPFDLDQQVPVITPIYKNSWGYSPLVLPRALQAQTREVINKMQFSKTNRPGFPGALKLWTTGAIAGLAGGAAEVSWIAIYANLSGGDAATVARGVTQTVFPHLLTPDAAVPLGIAIHMGLAILLGIAIFALVRSFLPSTLPAAIEPIAVVGLLVGVWGVNFFIILPALNPAFTTVVPYTTSLISKVLFGAAAALVFKFLGGTSPVAGKLGKEIKHA